MAEKQPFNVTVVPPSKPKLSGGPADTAEPTSLPSTDGNNVSFVNITYTIQVQSRLKSLFVKLPPKKILDDVSGSMEPGLNAIMGPSGSGKTSLLDVLADRKNKKGLSGHVLINGRRQPKNFKCASAYVVQEDLLMGTLSVRENISFSAALRLPKSMSARQRAEKVETVINELGLSHVATTQIGTELIRGISGGQKKRTSIGMELIISPDIIFLDEPTTGLDASTAVSVIKLLKDLSRVGRVIIMSIHQPRYSIYKLFDSVTLMSYGHIVYHGPTANALNYFSRLGYQCEHHNNPADFLLDVIMENEQADDSQNATVYSINQEQSVVPASRLVKVYAESKESFTLKQHLDQKLEVALGEPLGKAPNFPTSFFWQLGVVALRTVRNLVRDRLSTGLQVGMMIGLAVVVGFIFFQLDDDFFGVQDRLGALFFLLAAMGIINIPAIDTFMRERPIFVHQNASGYYRISAYFLAKIFCDLIPIRVIPVIIFCSISYWMIGFEEEFDKFLFFMLTLVLTATTAACMAFAISARAPVTTVAIMGMGEATVLQMIFAGFLINLNSIDDWISWIQYLSIFRYGLNAITYNELEGNDYPDNCVNAKNRSCSAFSCLDGDDYLDDLGYSEYDVWYNIAALGGFNVFYLILAYISLRLLKKDK